MLAEIMSTRQSDRQLNVGFLESLPVE